MSPSNFSHKLGRRTLIQSGAALAASAIFAPLTGCALLGGKTANGIPATRLNNGLQMPMLGFGTYTLRDETCVRCVSEALGMGYRLLDTATIYGNEEAVGEGIRHSGVDRKELFITSKVWVDDSGIEKAKQAFQTSLDKLGTDYMDLYLIHRPRGDVKGSWQAMEELYSEGKIKAIGLSNFAPHQLDELMTYAKVEPAVNQIEAHAFFQQRDSYKVMNSNHIKTEAWAPFAEGRNGLFTNKTLKEIGEKYGKSNAQVSLRWHYQRGIIAIPRTVQKVHMAENLNIFDFALTQNDMDMIAGLDLNATQFPEWS